MLFSLGNWIFEVRRRAALIVPLKRPKEMSELELTSAFAVHEGHKLYRAVLQLLETAEDNAHKESEEFIDQPNRVFACIGQARMCAVLRKDFAARRELGLPALRLVKPQTRGPYERPELETSG